MYQRMGYLIYKSGWFPKILGVLVIVAGFGYYLSAFTHILLPHNKTISQTLELVTYGEVLFMIWVLVKGAKLPKA